MIYRFEDAEGKLLKIDTDTANLLASTEWEAGRNQPRWIEVYRSPKGRYIQIHRTLWQGEKSTVAEMEEAEALDFLARCEPRQRTEEGDELLVDKDPAEEI